MLPGEVPVADGRQVAIEYAAGDEEGFDAVFFFDVQIKYFLYSIRAIKWCNNVLPAFDLFVLWWWWVCLLMLDLHEVRHVPRVAVFTQIVERLVAFVQGTDS